MPVDVRFEPTGLGERNGRLLLSPPAGGDFICILKGSAQPPRPQGPIEVKVSSRLSRCSSSCGSLSHVACRLPVAPLSISRTFIPRPPRSPSRATTLHSPPQTRAASSLPRQIKPQPSHSRRQRPARLQSASCRSAGEAALGFTT